MKWGDDYVALNDLLVHIETRFRELHPGKTSFMLDYEYKKMNPDKLIVKQVREVALPDTKPSLTPFLINDPREVCTFQGEYGDVFANDRLKARLGLTTKSEFLTPAALAATFFDDTSASFVASGAVKTLTGSPASWPSANHEFSAGEATETFKDGVGAEERTYTLIASPVPELRPPSLGTLVALRDFKLLLQADYAAPVAALDWDGTPITCISEMVELESCPKDGAPDDGAVFVQRAFSVPSGVSVKISFYYPPYPTGAIAGYTAPLHKWVETTIEGLTQSPIVLKGYYAQTYRPQHHNFTEDFVFEPRLEEGISPEVLAELQAKDIRMIFVSGSQFEETPTKIITIDSMGAFHSMN